jgi:alkylhydroperoxidase/carboxymuconolactone decarboxylase family protein YurZ
MSTAEEQLMDTPSPKDLFPALQEEQAAYLGAIDSLQSPDRKTSELIRLTCSVILRHASGIRHHAMLAAEMGATWEDIAGTLVLTQPSFGLVPAVEALDPAREGFEAASTESAD